MVLDEQSHVEHDPLEPTSGAGGPGSGTRRPDRWGVRPVNAMRSPSGPGSSHPSSPQPGPRAMSCGAFLTRRGSSCSRTGSCARCNRPDGAEARSIWSSSSTPSSRSHGPIPRRAGWPASSACTRGSSHSSASRPRRTCGAPTRRHALVVLQPDWHRGGRRRRLSRVGSLVVLVGLRPLPGREPRRRRAGPAGRRRPRRFPLVPSAARRLPHRRQLARRRPAGHRQQGHRGRRRVRARVPDAVAHRLRHGAAAPRPGAQRRPALPHAVVRRLQHGRRRVGIRCRPGIRGDVDRRGAAVA